MEIELSQNEVFYSESESELGHASEDECASNIENLNTSMEEQKCILEKRLDSLKNYMVNLKEGLAKERALWKQEVEEVGKLSKPKECKCNCMCEVENAVRATTSNSEIQPTLNDMSILDYEKKLNMYQDALLRAHAEKKMHLRRHFAAHAYKTKLMEVENMCNLELMKVKQNVQFLQPLQAMASEWNISNQLDDEITGGANAKMDNLHKKESTIAIESFGSIVSLELKELSDRLSTTPINSTFDTNSSIHEDDADSWINDRNSNCSNVVM